MSKRYGTIEDRFHAQYIPEPNSGCWLWTGAWRGKDIPYGLLRLENSKKKIFAHRFSFMLATGKSLRSEDFVCHTCDNPYCVNPDHLFLGDKYLNVEDRDRKGRQMKGETHYNAKLNEETIRAIRKSNETLRTLSKIYDTHISNIWRIKRRLAWKHVT